MEPRQIRAKHLIWNKWNRAHIAKHHLTPRQVETVLLDEKRTFMAGRNNRLAILGRMGKRLVIVFFARMSEKKFYAVSARDMAKEERKIYRANV